METELEKNFSPVGICQGLWWSSLLWDGDRKRGKWRADIPGARAACILPEAAKSTWLRRPRVNKPAYRQARELSPPTLSYITELMTKSVTSDHPPLNLNNFSSHSS